MSNSVAQTVEERLVRVTAAPASPDGNLSLPEGSRAIVLFAHGSGSSRGRAGGGGRAPRRGYVRSSRAAVVPIWAVRL